MFKQLLSFMTKAVESPKSVVIGLVAVAIIAVFSVVDFDSIGKFFGYQTRAELKCENKDLRSQVDTVVEVNKDVNKQKDLVEKTVENTDKVISTQIEKEKKADAVVKKINRETAKKIDEVLSSGIDQEEKTREISRVQIESLWETFCTFNKSTSCA